MPPRILLIEDNPADVLLIKLALHENAIAHTLVEFENGAQAIESLCNSATSQVPPHAILLDLNTPRSNGFDTLDKLRHRFPGIPITILTSSHARQDRERAARAGAIYPEKASHLSKFLESVADAVREMLKLDRVSHDTANPAGPPGLLSPG